MTLRIIGLMAMCFLSEPGTIAQTNTVIVVMGSSTAAGSGASIYDSSWVGRLAKNVRREMTDNKDTTVINIALGGTTTYVGREIGFVPPSGYAGPDPERNIEKALALNPDIILVNYPSNDVANNIPTSVTMQNYQVYNTRALNAGKKIYFLTTQPRNSVSYNQQVQLKDQKGTIIDAYPNTSINVWDPLVAPDGLSINPELNADDTHVKDAGHRRIYEAVAALVAPAALLPVKLSRFTAEAADKKVKLYWETVSEKNSSHFIIERSTDNRDFKEIGKLTARGNSTTLVKYKFSDQAPMPGKSFYRLKQVDLDGSSTLSPSVQVTVKTAPHAIQIYPVPTTHALNLKIAAEKKENIMVSIFDRSGNVRGSYPKNLQKGENLFNFPVQNLPNGNYLLQIKTESTISKRSFIKL